MCNDEMNRLCYRGYETLIHYSAVDDVLYGRIEGIDDLVSFESVTSGGSSGIVNEFHNAVDDYIEFKNGNLNVFERRRGVMDNDKSNTLNGIRKVDYAPNYDEKSNAWNATDFADEGNYSKFCWYRLPCGICTKTNSMCPMFKGQAGLEITCKE